MRIVLLVILYTCLSCSGHSSKNQDVRQQLLDSSNVAAHITKSESTDIPLFAQKIIKSYPLFDIHYDNNKLVFADGTKIVYEETVGENGEIIEVETEKEITTLYITVSHLTAEEMAEKYGFTEEQKDTMRVLLSDEYRAMWGTVLYGIKSGETAIIEVAASQIGNVGGEPYWSYFGFTSRIAWCACFVSWCGNECGYIENGIMPNTISCVTGMNWYKERGLWLDGNQEPVPGMIIFYDWDNPDGEFGPQDGKPDHTGIVAKVENGTIWTIEGNSGDACRMNQHPVGEYVIMGYGCPRY